MIKGITIVRSSPSAAEHERLTQFFTSLGFEPGKSWQDQGSRGASFLAPLGNLEFVDGEMPGNADL